MDPWSSARSRVVPSTIAIMLLLGGCGGSGNAGDDSATTSDSTPVISAAPDEVTDDETTGALGIALTTEGGSAGGPLEVTVELTNDTDGSVTVVRPFLTPNFVSFDVQHADGTAMPFFGPHPQLRPLGDEHFVLLAPGESVIEVIDLWPGYQLDPGSYTVSAEYLNPAAGSHEGGRAAIFEPGDGPLASPVELVVAS